VGDTDNGQDTDQGIGHTLAAAAVQREVEAIGELRQKVVEIVV
jgi:hypothetical protein